MVKLNLEIYHSKFCLTIQSATLFHLQETKENKQIKKKASLCKISFVIVVDSHGQLDVPLFESFISNAFLHSAITPA